MDYVTYFVQKFQLDLRPKSCVEVDVKSAKSVLYPGAQIGTSIPFDYYHHGIVLDPNAPEISIIHLWGPNKENNRVQVTTLPLFLAGGPDKLGIRSRNLYLINYDGDTSEKQQKTVETAKDLLKNADDVVYDMVRLNCESFANYCRTGQWTSDQVEKLKYFLIQKAGDVLEEIKNPDEKNRQQICSLLQSVRSDSLNPSEQLMYHQLCQCYRKELLEQ